MQQLQADYREARCRVPVAYSRHDVAKILVEHIELYGFVVCQAPQLPPPTFLSSLATTLGLGSPYVPTLYRVSSGELASIPYNDVRSDPQAGHPGFNTTAGQAWHVDGLLEEIGEIKTTVLYCVRPALEGGDTLIFNSIAAFAKLREHSPLVASSLLSPVALKRTSSIPGPKKMAIGPAFGYDPFGSLMTRYTDNETCTWNTSNPQLKLALECLRTASLDPRYRAAIRLLPGQALIFRNDRISHGRESYQDDLNARRHLVRGLYLNAPGSLC